MVNDMHNYPIKLRFKESIIQNLIFEADRFKILKNYNFYEFYRILMNFNEDL